MLQEVLPQAYTEFQPLEEILVGKGYSKNILSDFHTEYMSTTTKRLLGYLLDETEEDYQNLIKIFETYGAKVYRPNYSDITQLQDTPYLMNPRDEMIVLGNKIIFKSLQKSTTKDLAIPLKKYKKYFRYEKPFLGLAPPSIIRLGKDIIVDSNDGANLENSYKYLKKILEPDGFNIIYYKTHNFKFEAAGCHADGCFAILKPGVLMTLRPEYMYTDGLFPNWDTCRLEGESWTKMEGWHQFSKTIPEISNYTYWFNNEKYREKEFFNYIDTWLSKWVGYAKETVFDLNIVSLDEHTVCVSNYNKQAFEYFKKHKIEPIITPFRHRYFWDGGLHCITIDIKRKGNVESYL
jgi:N-dimethylarginine dimethylaminohydrolase